MIENDYNLYIDELHERNYSIYDSNHKREVALKELHERSYMIFDEEESENLHQEYLAEFDKNIHNISLTSQNSKDKEDDIFSLNDNIRDIAYNTSFSEKKKAIVELISMLSKIVSFKNNRTIFYISEFEDLAHYCKASGYYDFLSKKFILCKSSILSPSVSADFLYSENDFERRKIIEYYCDDEKYGFVLYRDIICKSPGQAASFVLGRKTDGLNEWSDDRNIKFGQYYKL